MKLYHEKELKKSPSYWEEKLDLIDDKDLRNWCGSVIWWDYSKDINVLDFHNKYVANYNNDHKFKRMDLQQALISIGYRH
jgi:hypothetical protein